MDAEQNVILQLEEAKDLDWDMAAFPVYPGKPITGTASAVGLIFTAPGKNKESASHVIETVTSDEREMELSKACGNPAVNTPEVMNQFCSDDTFLKGKNLQ